jgi:hypothetical protein
MASTSASPLCSSPAPWRPGEAANSSVKRKQAVRLGEGATWPAPALQPLHERSPVQQLRLQAGSEAADGLAGMCWAARLGGPRGWAAAW